MSRLTRRELKPPNSPFVGTQNPSRRHLGKAFRKVSVLDQTRGRRALSRVRASPRRDAFKLPRPETRPKAKARGPVCFSGGGFDLRESSRGPSSVAWCFSRESLWDVPRAGSGPRRPGAQTVRTTASDKPRSEAVAPPAVVPDPERRASGSAGPFGASYAWRARFLESAVSSDEEERNTGRAPRRDLLAGARARGPAVRAG